MVLTRERLTGPVRCARAVFVKHDAGGKLKVILEHTWLMDYCLGQDPIQSTSD